METDIVIRFGLVETTKEVWELLFSGFSLLRINKQIYEFKKELVQWKENDEWLHRQCPYGARIILTDEKGNIIAWRRLVETETPLTGNFRGI